MTTMQRLACAVGALALLASSSPAAAQGVATVYLKEGGTIKGQIVDESDANSVRVRSEKSGTTFLLKRTWIDSIVRPAPAPAAIKPAPAPAPVPAPASPIAPPVAASPAPAPATASSQPVSMDGLEAPPPRPAAKPLKSEKAKSSSQASSPSKWYIGGGGSAYTGAVGDVTDIGYSGMVGYGTGLGSALAVRMGGSGSYWRLGNDAGDFYDLAGNIDFIVGPRSPRFLSPYAVVGGMGGVRSASSTQVGVTGYSRDPLYGARAGIGLSAKRIFLEASYQHVWVNGTTSGYVPFVLGFRF